MSLATFKNILKKFENEKHIDLNLFWGEPLLNQEIIDYVIWNDFCFTQNIEKISINTNGILLNKKIRDFALKNKEKVIIDLSLDGNREIHDYYRKDIWGKGTYDKIIQNIFSIEDFSNYNINFCVSPFASDKLFISIENLYNLGFRKIKLIFLYEKYWSYDNIHKLCWEFLKLKSFPRELNLNIFHPYISRENECKNDFLESFTFLPSGELIPCPVWISKNASAVPDISPFYIKEIKEKEKIIQEKVFWNPQLSSIITSWAICESIQWENFLRNKKIIEALLSKIYKYE